MNVSHGKTKCVFHNDNNPSMMINEKKNIAKCFACGVGGNPITFVQKYEKEINHNNISKIDAIIKLVEKFNLDINISKLKRNKLNYQYKVASKTYSKEEQELLSTNEYLSKLFNYNLYHHSNREALDYLHSRGLTDEMIKEMNLGFCMKGQLLNVKDNSSSKINKEQLKKLGFISDDNREIFQNRIMFPITDEKGNIVSFAGRILTDEKPKYLHTFETSIFKKEELLYNFSNVKTLSYNDEIFIVEGYMDVIGAKSKGINNVVALMGTALTEAQLNLLKKNKCSITLALDNDEAGQNAMLEKIPELLKNKLDVSVIDLSKLGNYKDFGDMLQTNISKEEINSLKVSGFYYLLEKKYFKNSDYSVSNIYKVFSKLKEEKIISTTLDKANFIEYLEIKTKLNYDKINDIINPQSIIKLNSLSSFNSIVIDNFVISSIEKYINNTTDKTLSSFYALNRDKINSSAKEVFNIYDVKFLNADKTSIDVKELLDVVLKLDSSYDEYKTLNSFQYENIFDKTYIKNINGSANVNLSYEQKKRIIEQFDNSFVPSDRLALEEVEELYIVNDISDLDGILNYDNKTIKMLKENIQNRMFLNQNKMDFFKFGSIFQNVEKEFISNEFKGKTGDFKTILLYNNLTSSLNLTKDNIIKENQEIKKELEQDYIFSINKMLLIKELENENSYFIRIPNTEAKDYFYLEKDKCNLSNNGDIIFSKLEANKTYKIYDKDGNYKYDKTSYELKKYWEDKTSNKKETIDSVNKELKPAKDNIIKVDFKKTYTSIKDPISKVFKSKIYEETDNGFYIKVDDPNILLFASKKICKWNQDKSFLIIHPKKNFLRGTDISKYSFDGKDKSFIKKLPFNEIENYLKMFYPAYLKRNIEKISVSKEKCNIVNNFIRIPIVLDSVRGYINASVFKCLEENNNIVLEFTKNEKFPFYSSSDNYIGNYSYEEIKEGLENNNNNLVNNNIDFSELIDNKVNKTFYTDNDVLEFESVMIEPTYECFEPAVHIKLNGNYLYKPEGRSVGAYHHELFQEGVFKNKEDLINFLNSYFSSKELRTEQVLEKEREVA